MKNNNLKYYSFFTANHCPEKTVKIFGNKSISIITPNKDARNLIDRHPPTDTSIPASVK
jgi:hypothetical protein